MDGHSDDNDTNASGTGEGEGSIASAPVPPPPSATAAAPSTASPGPARLIDPDREPTRLRPQWIAAALLGAVATDISLRYPPWNNIAGTLMFLALISALLITGVVHTRPGRIALGAAAVFALLLSVRSDPMLSAFNFFAAAGLLAFGGFHGRGRNPWRWTPQQGLSDLQHTLSQGFDTALVEFPNEAAAWIRTVRNGRTGRSESSTGSSRAVVRGLALALPILAVFGLLLASADAVFESIFGSLGLSNLGFNGWPLMGHLVLLGLGAVGTVVMLRIAATAGDSTVRERPFTVGAIESTIVLVGVNVLFAVFALAQLLTIVGGADAALERAGVDPKEFARQGFFQLLWVAALTLLLLMALRSTRDPDDGKGRRFVALTLTAVGLTMLIVVVALTRLGFYIGEEGQTPLRFYSSVFSLFVALSLVVISVRILGWRPDTPWLTTSLIAATAVVGLVLNVMDPEAFMVRDNLDRDHEHLVYHLRPEHRQFTGDGWATIVDGIDQRSPEIAQGVEIQLCREHDDRRFDSSSLFEFNLGNWRGDDALQRLCGSDSGLFD